MNFLNNLKCEVKNLELISKYIYLFIYFKGLYITPQKDEMNYIE
jgi:hypothetical protein